MNTQLTSILYVEDEPDIQTVAKLALEMIGGFSVEIASSGEEALQYIKTKKPQLFLLDVMLPKMDGPTILTHLKANPEVAHIPVIFITAKAQHNEVAHYLKMGAVAVLQKPFDPMTLSDEIRAIWASL